MAGPAYFTAREPPQGTYNANVGSTPVEIVTGVSVALAPSYDVSDWKGMRISVLETIVGGLMSGRLDIYTAMLDATANFEHQPTIEHPYSADDTGGTLQPSFCTNYVVDFLDAGSRFVRFVETGFVLGTSTIYLSRIV